jgi:uncharacterized protein YggE
MSKRVFSRLCKAEHGQPRVLAALLCGAIVLGCTTPADAEPGEGARVRSTGDATLSLTPDRAVVRVAVVTESETAEPAVVRNAELADSLVKALSALLGDDGKLASEGYSLTPRYEYDRKGGGGRVLQGYSVRSALRVSFDDVEQVGKVIDVATASGANEVVSISFTLRDDSEARARALAEATRAARAKADVMAEAIGGSVLRVVAVEEGGAVVRPALVRGRSEAFAITADSRPATSVEVGDVKVRATVQMEVELAGER